MTAVAFSPLPWRDPEPLGPPGPAQQLTELYQRHAPAIYAHCRRLMGSAAGGWDAVQESFLRLLQHQTALGPGDQALHYLYRTSTNVCINHLRQRAVRQKAAPEIAARAAFRRNEPAPVSERQLARRLLDSCDATGAAVAVMCFVDGMSQVEAARALGISRRTVYSRIRQIERIAAKLLDTDD